jgi:hypothetical protein
MLGVPPPQWTWTSLRPVSEMAQDERDLLPEQSRIGIDRHIAPGGLRMAAAVMADGAAEGHMQVKRDGRLQRSLFQPYGTGRAVNIAGKLRCRRIGGVVRHISRHIVKLAPHPSLSPTPAASSRTNVVGSSP